MALWPLAQGGILPLTRPDSVCRWFTLRRWVNDRDLGDCNDSLSLTFGGHGVGTFFLTFGVQEPHCVSETSRSAERLEKPSSLVQTRDCETCTQRNVFMKGKMFLTLK